MKLLDDDAITSGLRGLNWRRDGAVLVRVVRSDDFAQSLDVVNRVAVLAEDAGHHPDIDIRWNIVTLRLTTHDAGGLTRRDLDLAGAIDDVLGVPPP